MDGDKDLSKARKQFLNLDAWRVDELLAFILLDDSRKFPLIDLEQDVLQPIAEKIHRAILAGRLNPLKDDDDLRKVVFAKIELLKWWDDHVESIDDKDVLAEFAENYQAEEKALENKHYRERYDKLWKNIIVISATAFEAGLLCASENSELTRKKLQRIADNIGYLEVEVFERMREGIPEKYIKSSGRPKKPRSSNT